MRDLENEENAGTTGHSAPSHFAAFRLELRENWRLLLAATIGVGTGLPALYYYSIGVFVPQLTASFHWNPIVTATGSSLMIGLVALASPFLGRLTDRIGSGTVAILSLAGCAVGYFLLSLQTGNILLFHATVVIVALLGCGTTPLTFSRMLVGAFRRARGTAIGLMVAGAGLSIANLPRLTADIVVQDGWRAGYRFLAILAFAAMILVARLTKKARFVPAPDNGPVQTGMTTAQARATSTFWLLALVMLLGACASGGMVINLIPVLTERGMTLREAATAASLLGVALIVGRLLTGYLLDRIAPHRIAAGVFLLGSFGSVSLFLPGPLPAHAAAFFVGLAAGGEVDVLSIAIMRYFGLRAYASIYGWLYAFFSVGLAAGPLLVGITYRFASDFSLANALFCGLFLAASVCAMLMRPPTTSH